MKEMGVETRSFGIWDIERFKSSKRMARRGLWISAFILLYIALYCVILAHSPAVPFTNAVSEVTLRFIKFERKFKVTLRKNF